VDLSEAQSQSRLAIAASRFERTVPIGVIDIHGKHFDAVLAGIPHELGRRIETHGLRIQQRGAKGSRMIMFDPGRDINEEREACGMALGKTVLAKTLDLVEASLGKV